MGLLLDAGVPNDIIYSGHIDLRGYKAHQLEMCGYMKASGDIGYIVRNTLEFLYEHSTPGDNIMSRPEQGGMTMQ